MVRLAVWMVRDVDGDGMRRVLFFFIVAVLLGSCQLPSKGNGKTLVKIDTKLTEIPATSKEDLLIAHKGYTLSYDVETHNPKWVAWSLSREKLVKRCRRVDDYRGDENIPVKDRVEKYAYDNRIYDRGHMCPSGDVRYDAEAQSDCFYMTNICPQVRVLNQTWWEHVESATRRWAQKDGCVYVCCGPIFYDDVAPKMTGRQLKVRVPDAFFKVILSLRKGKEKAIGFYYKNNEDRQTMDFAKHSVDEIEEMTGMDFFCNLPDKLEEKVEAMCDLRSWD